MNTFSNLGIKPKENIFIGKKIEADDILDLEIIILDFEIRDSNKFAGTKCLYLQIELDGKKRVVFTGGKTLIDVMSQVTKDKLPIKTKIAKEDRILKFTL